MLSEDSHGRGPELGMKVQRRPKGQNRVIWRLFSQVAQLEGRGGDRSRILSPVILLNPDQGAAGGLSPDKQLHGVVREGAKSSPLKRLCYAWLEHKYVSKKENRTVL